MNKSIDYMLTQVADELYTERISYLELRESAGQYRTGLAVNLFDRVKVNEIIAEGGHPCHTLANESHGIALVLPLTEED
jgi:hypothetical protein